MRLDDFELSKSKCGGKEKATLKTKKSSAHTARRASERTCNLEMSILSEELGVCDARIHTRYRGKAANETAEGWSHYLSVWGGAVGIIVQIRK